MNKASKLAITAACVVAAYAYYAFFYKKQKDTREVFINDFESVEKYFEYFGQEHVFDRFNELLPTQQERLIDQCKKVDLGVLLRQFEELKQAAKIHSIEKFPPSNIFHNNIASEDERNGLRRLGLEAIADGKVAAILLGGGQGTRLGSSLPKAVFDIGLPSRKTLLQLQAERIARLRVLASTELDRDISTIHIPWCIMTNEESYDLIVQVIQDKHFYGLPSEDIFVFKQSMLPSLDSETGKIMKNSPSELALSPNGNGGVYASLASSGLLRELIHRNIQIFHIYGVDNALVKVVDPTAIGLLISKPDCMILNKTVPRKDENEAVGVFCLRNNKPAIAEYSEIGPQLASLRDENDMLVYSEANIVSHFIKAPFMNRILSNLNKLPYHVAKKEYKPNPQYSKDNTTKFVYKFELFVFDVLALAKPQEVLLFSADRSEEFAPVKNKNVPGMIAKDSPDSAVLALSDYHASLLKKANVTLVRKEQDPNEPLDPEQIVEISPRCTYDGEGLTFAKDILLQCPVTLEI